MEVWDPGGSNHVHEDLPGVLRRYRAGKTVQMSMVRRADKT